MPGARGRSFRCQCGDRFKAIAGGLRHKGSRDFLDQSKHRYGQLLFPRRRRSAKLFPRAGQALCHAQAQTDYTCSRKCRSAMKEMLADAVACPVCKGFTTDVYVDGEDQNLETSTIGSSRKSIRPGRILRCRNCRFGFRQTRSSPEQLGELYRQMDPEVYELELEGRKRTAQRHLRIVRQHVRAGRLLDVGCASGLFLAHALRAGWEVTGIEPNEKLCQQAEKNLNGMGKVLCATMETACFEGRFDAITLWDVLEHVSDPVRFLLNCCHLLKSNAY